MATTTPNYGWDVPTSSDYVAQGAVAIETLGDDIDAFVATAFNSKLRPGLVLVKTQAITPGVTSVTVSNAFSTTFENYKIILSNFRASAAVSAGFRLNNVNSNYYYTNTSAGTYATASGNVTFSNAAGASNYDPVVVAAATTNEVSGCTLELQNPFLAVSTAIQSSASDTRVGGAGPRTGSGYHATATSYTDCTFFLSGGVTFTTGNIAIYGYAKD